MFYKIKRKFKLNGVYWISTLHEKDEIWGKSIISYNDALESLKKDIRYIESNY